MLDIANAITSVHNALNAMLGGNQFAVGMVLAALPVAITFILRKVPAWLFHIVVSHMTTSVRVNNSGWHNSRTFIAMTKYIQNHSLPAFSRKLAIESTYEQSTGYRSMLAIGIGWHLFRFNGRFMFVRREEYPQNQGDTIKEYIDIVAFGRSSILLSDLLSACQPEESQAHIRVFGYSRGTEEWTEASKNRGGGLKAIALDPAVRQHFVDMFTAFADNRELYYKLGIAHKLTILLHGKPGSGKTSLVRALASEFNYNIYNVNLASWSSSPDLFISVVNSIPKGSIVLVEDFEESPWVKCRAELSDSTLPAAKDTCVHGGRSALLNWLDGVSSLDGKIIILSTNTVEVVDKALLRPGRLDHLVELPDLTTDVIMTHCLDLWPELSEYQVEYSQLPGCVLHRIKTIALDNVELVAKLLNEYAKNPELAMLEQSGNVAVRNPF